MPKLPLDTLAPAALRPVLEQGYADAFQQLTWLLAGLTVAAALAVYFFLGRVPGVEQTDAG